MTTVPTSLKSSPVFLGISCYLIVRCLWRVFFHGGSWAMPPWHYLSMASDAALLLVLVLMYWVTDARALDQHTQNVRTGLFWASFLGGVVLILIRFTSGPAWWTGHLMN